MLSVVVPTDADRFAGDFSAFAAQDLEVIYVGLREARSRAQRLNIGFHRAHGEIILFHHPRSQIEPRGVQKLIEWSRDPERPLIWGGFTHAFDMAHPFLKFTSWYSNRVRGRRGILYLDHCIFFDRRLWRNDLPPVEIFEDTLLSRALLKTAKPVILPFKSITSAIRFQKNGFLRQGVINQILKVAFFLGVSDDLMNRIYEYQLQLNSR